MQIKSLLKDVSAGLVASLLSLAYCFSFGALVFSGPLQAHLSVGIQAALISAGVTGLIIALGSGFRVVVGGPDGNTAALLAAMIGGLAPVLATLPPEEALSLALAGLLAASLVAGAALYLLGHFRLGRYGRFVPYPMVAGFLGATGWLMITGAVRMVTDLPVQLASLAGLARPAAFIPLAVTVGWAGVLWLVTARVKHLATLPILLLGGALLGDLVLQLGDAPLGVDAAHWMFAGGSTEHAVAPPPFDPALWQADWPALLTVGGTIAAAALMSTLSVVMNSTGLEQVMRTDVDLDRELRVHGVANVASGLAGGFIGYTTMSRTVLAYAAGGTGRLAGITVALVALAMLAGGIGLIGVIPRFVLGGLLMQLGAQLIWTWCIASRKRLPIAEWLLVPVVVVMTAGLGVLAGFAVGILGGCAIFAFSVSRIDTVHRQFGAEERPSSLVRSTDELAVLRDRGHEVRIIELGSFVFFGSAYRLQEQIAELVRTLSPCMVIFDFSAVSGIDSSAGSSFLRIAQRLKDADVRHVTSGLNPLVRAVMAETGALKGALDYATLDEALEAGETLLLQRHGQVTAGCRPLIDWFTDALGRVEYARDLMAALEPARPVDAQFLCHQGDDNHQLLFVEHGRVSVLIERPGQAPIRHRVFGANTLIGEIGFFLGVPRTASLRLEGDTRVWSLDRDRYDRLRRDQPDLAAALLTYTVRTQAERLAFATRQLEALQR